MCMTLLALSAVLDLGVGDMAKISYHVFFFKYHNFIMILCHVGFTILSDQCSQNSFPIIKTRPFKVTNIK